MKKCPYCGQPTSRTEDWACQWCANPLLSDSYETIPKTYRQLQEERNRQKVAEPEAVYIPRQVEGRTEPSPEPPKAEPDYEPRGEQPEAQPSPEASQNQPGAAPEPELKPETTQAPSLSAEELELKCISVGVTAQELASAYESGGAIDARLKGKVVKLTGLVARAVAIDHLDIYYLILAGIGDAWNIRCIFDRTGAPQLKRLSAGQKVTVQGRHSGYEKNILIKECVFI